MPTPQESHQLRQIAESFGVDAARYDRARPRYPDALVRAIAEASPGLDVLSVGCGTGIDARQFQAAGHTVLGVEPDPRMAAYARGTGVPVEEATFEQWDPAGRSFDAVVSGQSWHWVDPVAGAAKAAEVLRPDGRLAVFWNAMLPGPDIAEAFSAAYARVLPGSLAAAAFSSGMPAVGGYSPFCAKAADAIRTTRAFTAPEEWRFDWWRVYTRDEWLDQMPTQGAHTRLAAPDLARLLAEFADVIDGLGGSFPLGYATVCVTAALA